MVNFFEFIRHRINIIRVSRGGGGVVSQAPPGMEMPRGGGLKKSVLRGGFEYFFGTTQLGCHAC